MDGGSLCYTDGRYRQLVLAAPKNMHIDPVATTHKNNPVQAISPVEVQQPIEEQDLRVVTSDDKQNPSVQHVARSVKHKALPPATDPDYSLVHNIESSFTQMINLQRNKLNSTPIYAESPAYFNDFKVQLKQMEKDEKQIKEDIAKNGINDELITQLINIYQQKLNMLKQLQIEMNKLNNRFKRACSGRQYADLFSEHVNLLNTPYMKK